MGEITYTSEEYLRNLDTFFTLISQTYQNAEKTYERELYHFFEVLAGQYRLIKKWEDEFNYYFGTKFNLIKIFKPDEVRISNVIAELLNPKGSHGQREVFLKCFLSEIYNLLKKEELNWLTNEYKWGKVKVTTEVDIGNGRIDIFIELPEAGAIVIENKPWAGEEESQLQRYADYLKNKYANKNYLLIFLTTEGREPVSLDRSQREELEKEGKFVVLSYNKFLKNWLKECAKHCEAEKVRTFLKDFIAWIETHFPKISSFEEN